MSLSVQALAHGALRLDLVLELVEEDLAVAVLIELLEHLLGLLLGHEETAALEDVHQLVGLDTPVRVCVQTIERLDHVEVGVCVQALAHGLRRRLHLEMNTPHVAMLDLRIWEETVIASVQVVAVV